ncbi:MAG: hypothetical protein WD738_16210 [Pirellulales bacterium]
MNIGDERIIYDETKKWRVRIFQAPNGSYGFVEEVFSDDPFELCWLPITAGRSHPVCDTVETALREAHGRIDWL